MLVLDLLLFVVRWLACWQVRVGLPETDYDRSGRNKCNRLAERAEKLAEEVRR